MIDSELKLRPDHPHLVDIRKLSVETGAHFGLGLCSHGTLKGAIAIPIHDENRGRLRERRRPNGL